MSMFEAFRLSTFSPRQCSRVAGRIISDGCRDYVVGIERDDSTETLTNRRGKPRRFASLAEAKQALRRANVADIRLDVRVAADEACAGSAMENSGFTAVRLAAPLKDDR